MATDLKIFTLNCWGIPVVSKDRKPRMKAIAEALSSSDYDLVCLQEVWTDSDFELIRDNVADVLPFSHYFYSGVVGSGICILSKHCLQDVFFHQWPVNGYVHKLQHGDWFGGKGVGLARLKINDLNINIYTAHLHAEYDRNCDEYQAHRVLQAYDTAQFIELTSGAADVIILAGDLNTEPGDLAYRILINLTRFTDSFYESPNLHPENINTNETVKNSYTSVASLAKRIDYIMYRQGTYVKIEMKKYFHPLPETVPGHSFSYSDHEAVAAHLCLTRNEATCVKCDAEAQTFTLKESVDVCDTAIRRLILHRRVYWLFSLVLFALLICTFATGAPFDLPVVYHILRALLTGAICFTVIMATLWNSIERNAVLAGKHAMELSLRYLKETKAS